MSIEIKKEEPDLGPPYEECYFCNQPTQFWAVGFDIPICEACAQNSNPDQLPSKEDYAKE